jgi:hypothetical protein
LSFNTFFSYPRRAEPRRQAREVFNPAIRSAVWCFLRCGVWSKLHTLKCGGCSLRCTRLVQSTRLDSWRAEVALPSTSVEVEETTTLMKLRDAEEVLGDATFRKRPNLQIAHYDRGRQGVWAIRLIMELAEPQQLSATSDVLWHSDSERIDSHSGDLGRDCGRITKQRSH